ncbi:unnamed protein product [Eruca vesicaria subsp. sativa]|uniref:Uncharacterized protein n=1 Tax=Eruca vesicaria subsp. sativa TaxID=29727 RepID=A0ABC8LRT1_ERUVS|nr:unnamed protein product [Eruca vesicaria subsp. sativa]
MAVPVIDLLNNSDSSSDEDFSDSEISYSSEDESMEEDDASVEAESSNSEITTARETETKRSEEAEEDEFWIRYPYLKSFLSTSVAQGLIPEYYVYERAKLIGDEKAKELNERGKALFIKDLEACKDKCELIASAITAMKSVK